MSRSIDQRSSRSITEHKRYTAFGSIHEALAYIPMDYEFTRFHNLPDLVLSITVNMDFHTVYTAGGIIPRGTIQIEADSLSF